MPKKKPARRTTKKRASYTPFLGDQAPMPSDYYLATTPEAALKEIGHMTTSIRVVCGDLERGFEATGVDRLLFGYAHDPQWLFDVARRIEAAQEVLRSTISSVEAELRGEAGSTSDKAVADVLLKYADRLFHA